MLVAKLGDRPPRARPGAPTRPKLKVRGGGTRFSRLPTPARRSTAELHLYMALSRTRWPAQRGRPSPRTPGVVQPLVRRLPQYPMREGEISKEPKREGGEAWSTSLVTCPRDPLSAVRRLCPSGNERLERAACGVGHRRGRVELRLGRGARVDVADVGKPASALAHDACALFGA